MFQEQDTISIEIKASGICFQGDIQCVREHFLVLDCLPADLLQCTPGTPIRVSQAADGILYQFEAEVARAQANTLIIPRQTPQIVQRRQSERIACELMGEYSWLRARNEGSKAVADEGSHRIKIFDLSMGGARGHVKEVLFVNTPLNLRLCLAEADEWITADVVVLRCRARPEGEIGTAEYPFEVCFRITKLDRMDMLALTRLVQKAIKAGAIISLT